MEIFSLFAIRQQRRQQRERQAGGWTEWTWEEEYRRREARSRRHQTHGRREWGRAASPRPQKGEKWHMGPKGSSTGAPELQDERAAGCRRPIQLDGSEKPLDLW